MPVSITKVKNRYQVSTPNMMHAKGTTKEKAEAQARLLNAIKHNPNFKPKGRSDSKATRYT